MFGGMIGKFIIKTFGLGGMTTFGNVANVFAQGLGILASNANLMYVHVLAGGFGERKRDAVETLIVKLGSEYGLGRGFLSAGMTNFRSIPNLVSPALWAVSYRNGAARGWPQLMFWMRVMVAAVPPELLYRSIPAAERK